MNLQSRTSHLVKKSISFSFPLKNAWFLQDRIIFFSFSDLFVFFPLSLFLSLSFHASCTFFASLSLSLSLSFLFLHFFHVFLLLHCITPALISIGSLHLYLPLFLFPSSSIYTFLSLPFSTLSSCLSITAAPPTYIWVCLRPGMQVWFSSPSLSWPFTARYQPFSTKDAGLMSPKWSLSYAQGCANQDHAGSPSMGGTAKKRKKHRLENSSTLLDRIVWILWGTKTSNY